jgi:hypothetical protein
MLRSSVGSRHAGALQAKLQGQEKAAPVFAGAAFDLQVRCAPAVEGLEEQLGCDL